MSLEFSQKDMEAVFQSREGQQLLTILQADGGRALSRASAALKAGDTAKALSYLQPMMDSPGAAQLIQEINRKRG